MTGPSQPECVPFFLDSAEHRLFALAGKPAGVAARHGILVCPAFAEEMNRTRRTVRLFCEEAAQRGMLVIATDLHGTGDSSGDFGDARWGQWLVDLGVAATWLQQQGCTSISLLGIRAGALLAWEILRAGLIPVRSVVLWQPVITGKAVVTDMLRARIAAASAQGARETVSGLRQQLADGNAVEAAGYLLAPELMHALDQAVIAENPGMPLPPVCWMEIVANEESSMRQAALDAIKRLQAAPAAIDLVRQPDPPFWGTTEITAGLGSVSSTVRWLAGGP